ncbi:M20 family metallopeptidase [Leptolyngbya sp. BC1307]|uniref:M20 family metallopeptidase n=1 Tax=Leptolyngbya sp. BC1307 TaxID=2029589 RepID=UPI000EFA3184|nr:M20 family metallopeptidase [Leptolyngbya sp. BC1307]
MLSTIQKIATKLSPRIIEIRRHVHSHPELSGQEYQTAAYISGVLSSCGFHVQEMVGKTGVVAELKGETPPNQDVLAIRADMDALPIVEKTDLPFVSKSPGIMHACGHDAHTAVGLGTAMVLAELVNSSEQLFPSTTRFLFQPAEETSQGAKWMIEDGVMQDVAAIFGLHVFPSIPAGVIGLRQGALTAAADDLEIVISGESGHGARPHEAIDAIWIAAQVITQLQQSISRTINPLHPAVITIGQISGGRAPNVIADQVRLTGTVRSLHADTHALLPEWIERIATDVCHLHGATCTVNYRRRCTSVLNDPDLTQLVADCASEALGSDRIQWIADASMGAEDFANYTSLTRGTMFRLGVGFAGRHNYSLHHSQFEIDETALISGVVTMAYSAYRYWQSGNGETGNGETGNDRLDR